jgi:hypothetical protein
MKCRWTDCTRDALDGKRFCAEHRWAYMKQASEQREADVEEKHEERMDDAMTERML